MKISMLCWMALAALPSPAQPLSTVSWSASVEKTGDRTCLVTFTGDIRQGWHTYDLHSGFSSTTVAFEPGPGVALDGEPYEVVAAPRRYDPLLEAEIGEYEGRIVLAQRVTVDGDGGRLDGVIEWRSCRGDNCNTPEEWAFSVSLPGSGVSAGGPATEPVTIRPIASEGPSPSGSDAGSLWGLVLAAIGWGLAALATPCVFPMIPMTVSFFLKGSGSPAAARIKASVYGLFIVALYTLPIAAIILTTYVAGGEAVTADIFNWLATHWLPNLIFFVVFMGFAASFFGAFEITLPSWLVNTSDRNADRGGMVGLFFMALTLVLVSFSCTGPIVGSALIDATSGEFWAPILTMFVFSLTFALPFTLFAMFPSLLRNLPKSGGWLNSVKVVLGFVEVALGFKFLSVADQTYHWNLLDREVYLAIWIVSFSLLGLYLLGKIRFAHDSECKHLTVPRLALSMACFTFVVYMIPGMWGAPLKALSGYLPPMHTQDFVLGQRASADAERPAMGRVKYGDFLSIRFDLPGYFELNEGLAAAAAQHKPVFVDVTGHGCVNCREMEERVWSDPRVQRLLRDEYVVVALYTDDKKRAEREDWIVADNGKELKDIGRINSYIARTRFGVNAQPTYILLDDRGEPLLPPRGYDLDVDAYVAFLEEGIRRFRNPE